ncbi:uncharacterized protein KY384_005728 [Bacidia gigantensis]|uniref:uncharacterized protein n=1 Tax=Bacidia gigantensis TaxID=2732470 RepID=UPI001D03CCEE|nr:uncharacterized protein KY384_005728 [Bacidia gigantensis]KAG8529093.1 hypothetical protein KY384_005728 [Bacidia gigantensis]
MTTSISTSIIGCLKSFNTFVDEAESRAASEQKTNAAAWKDELGRVRMWAANIGAHKTGQSSLDFRLRDASHVRDQILKLLTDVSKRLQEAREILAEDIEEDQEELSDDSSDSEDATQALDELRQSTATIIDCLFQMSMLVRKPAQHDAILKSRRAEVAAYEPFDYNHVREKYPKSDDLIVQRLGHALTRRRKYLKYRERHAMKLMQGIDKVTWNLEGESNVEGTVSLLSDTIATNLEEKNIHFDEGASDSGVTQTSYAQTLQGGGDITIPRPPKASKDKRPFECPYCHIVITISGTKSWNRHVFQDLQPYVCMLPNCTTPDKLYATRHEWLHHLKSAHAADIAGDTIPASSPLHRFTCVLCQADFALEKVYERHVARHLQELALFILPRNDDDISDGETQSGGSEAHSSDESVAAHAWSTFIGYEGILINVNPEYNMIELSQVRYSGTEARGRETVPASNSLYKQILVHMDEVNDLQLMREQEQEEEEQTRPVFDQGLEYSGGLVEDTEFPQSSKYKKVPPGMIRYYIRGDDISFEVLKRHINSMLGAGATAAAPTALGGRTAYMITAYRELTEHEIQELKQMSKEYEASKDGRVNDIVNQDSTPESWSGEDDPIRSREGSIVQRDVDRQSRSDSPASDPVRELEKPLSIIPPTHEEFADTRVVQSPPSSEYERHARGGRRTLEDEDSHVLRSGSRDQSRESFNVVTDSLAGSSPERAGREVQADINSAMDKASRTTLLTQSRRTIAQSEGEPRGRSQLVYREQSPTSAGDELYSTSKITRQTTREPSRNDRITITRKRQLSERAALSSKNIVRHEDVLRYLGAEGRERANAEAYGQSLSRGFVAGNKVDESHARQDSFETPPRSALVETEENEEPRTRAQRIALQEDDNADDSVQTKKTGHEIVDRIRQQQARLARRQRENRRKLDLDSSESDSPSMARRAAWHVSLESSESESVGLKPRPRTSERALHLPEEPAVQAIMDVTKSMPVEKRSRRRVQREDSSDSDKSDIEDGTRQQAPQDEHKTPSLTSNERAQQQESNVTSSIDQTRARGEESDSESDRLQKQQNMRKRLEYSNLERQRRKRSQPDGEKGPERRPQRPASKEPAFNPRPADDEMSDSEPEHSAIQMAGRAPKALTNVERFFRRGGQEEDYPTDLPAPDRRGVERGRPRKGSLDSGHIIDDNSTISKAPPVSTRQWDPLQSHEEQQATLRSPKLRDRDLKELLKTIT